MTIASLRRKKVPPSVPVFIVPQIICLFLLFAFVQITRDAAHVVVSLVMDKKKIQLKQSVDSFLSIFVLRSLFFGLKT